jgi:hypothetical protein
LIMSKMRRSYGARPTTSRAMERHRATRVPNFYIVLTTTHTHISRRREREIFVRLQHNERSLQNRRSTPPCNSQLLCQGTYPLSFRRLGLEFSLLGNVTLSLALRESRTCHGIYVVVAVSVAVREGMGRVCFLLVERKERTRKIKLSYILRGFLYQTRLPLTTLLGCQQRSRCTPTTLLQENGKSMVINGTSTLASQ